MKSERFHRFHFHFSAIQVMPNSDQKCKFPFRSQGWAGRRNGDITRCPTSAVDAAAAPPDSPCPPCTSLVRNGGRWLGWFHRLQRTCRSTRHQVEGSKGGAQWGSMVADHGCRSQIWKQGMLPLFFVLSLCDCTLLLKVLI